MFCDGCAKDLAMGTKLRGGASEVRLVFDSEVPIEPGEVGTIVARPQVMFQPRCIVIVENYASFVIKAFIIGKRSQYWADHSREEIPGHVFQPMPYPIPCVYEKAVPGMNITFEVKNISEEPSRFIAHLSGFDMVL